MCVVWRDNVERNAKQTQTSDMMLETYYSFEPPDAAETKVALESIRKTRQHRAYCERMHRSAIQHELNRLQKK